MSFNTLLDTSLIAVALTAFAYIPASFVYAWQRTASPEVYAKYDYSHIEEDDDRDTDFTIAYKTMPAQPTLTIALDDTALPTTVREMRKYLTAHGIKGAGKYNKAQCNEELRLLDK